MSAMLYQTTDFVFYLFMYFGSGVANEEMPAVDDKVTKALKYVKDIRPDTCNSGVGEVLKLDFDVTVWNQYTDPAIRNANFLSKVIATNDDTLNSLNDEMLFLLVRNMVHGDSLIFGGGFALAPGTYTKYSTFCPYAYKTNSTVRSHDLSLNYNYLDPNTEYYYSLKTKDFQNVTMVTDIVSYRQNMSELPEITEVIPIAQLSDGHWTKPYYDCGGGNIWMVTYSSPILSVSNGIVVFRGVVGIDIEMSSIDINQCDPDDTDVGTAFDVFRGTHRCSPTTKCVPARGFGFVVGAYNCQCKDGYYFPDLKSPVKAYRGNDIEAAFRRLGSQANEVFRCVPCATGCDACVDNSPCLYGRNQTLLVVLTLLLVATIVGFICVAAMMFFFRKETAIKSASPIFLKIMCLGGVLMCFEFFTEHFERSIGLCSCHLWLFHLGFFILYGALVLKTWRISVIFTVGTQKRVRLPDQALLQRFGFLMLLAVGILTAWNASQMPYIDTIKAGNGLKFYVCVFGPWEFAVFGVETAFLLYGVYLCFTVRKAPALFNESKHITWAVYNAIILGSVVTLMARLLTSIIGPDWILLLHFARIHIYSTMTISFIFVPKFYAIYKKIEVGPHDPTTNAVSTVTGRVKRHQIAPTDNVVQHMRNQATQTE